MDNNIFICGEIDEEEDYYQEFKDVVDKIAEYYEGKMNVKFEIEEYYLQAVDVYDCNYISYVANIDNCGNKLRIVVPIDQFAIFIEDSSSNKKIISYCDLEIPQYDQENLNLIKDTLIDFESKLSDLNIK